MAREHPDKKPGKRVIMVQLSQVDDDDPKAILDALRDALRANDITLRALGLNPPSPPAPPADPAPVPVSPPERQVAVEQLEAKVVDLASAVLEAEAQRIRESGENPRFSPLGWFRAIRALLGFTSKAAAERGIELTVEETARQVTGA